MEETKQNGSDLVHVIKFGGSLLTVKGSPETYNGRASRLLDGLRTNSIVVHGSGSFGKPPAVRYGYLDGIVSKDKICSIMHVRAALSRLNGMFLEDFARQRIKAAGISATSLFCRSEKGRLLFTGQTVIRRFLESGVVPVVYSDFIQSEEGTWRVLSSDDIVVRLARKFKPHNVVFATDVDGVMLNYESGNGSLCREVQTDSVSELKRHIRRESLDLTGGMLDKLLYAARAVRFARRVAIVNGNFPRRIGEFCDGKEVIGTRIIQKGPGAL